MGLVVAVAAVLLVIVLLASTSGSTNFDGANHNLYRAMTIYGDSTPRDQADTVVQDIADQAGVSHRKAQQLAVTCVQNHIALSNCAKLSYVSVKSEQLRDEGILPK